MSPACLERNPQLVRSHLRRTLAEAVRNGGDEAYQDRGRAGLLDGAANTREAGMVAKQGRDVCIRRIRRHSYLIGVIQSLTRIRPWLAGSSAKMTAPELPTR